MFGNNVQRTPKQKAERAMLGIFARLAGCGYLIYIMVKLLTTPSEDSTTLTTVIAIVMLALSVIIIGMTIKDLIDGIKTGRFKASTYEEAELNEYLKRKAEEGGDTDSGPEYIEADGGEDDGGDTEVSEDEAEQDDGDRDTRN